MLGGYGGAELHGIRQGSANIVRGSWMLQVCPWWCVGGVAALRGWNRLVQLYA